MSDPQAQADPPPQKTFRLATRLLASFGLICGTLLALGGLFFFSLRSIEKLNASERSSVWIEISQLHRAANTLGELQAEVFRHVVASAPAELLRRKEAIAQLAQIHTEIVSSCGRFSDNQTEKQLFAVSWRRGASTANAPRACLRPTARIGPMQSPARL